MTNTDEEIVVACTDTGNVFLTCHLASFRGQEKEKMKSSFTKAGDHGKDNSQKEKSSQNTMSVTPVTKECEYLCKRANLNRSTILAALCIKT